MEEGELYWREFFQRRNEDLRKILEEQISAIPAKVIFRNPSSWSSSLWINVGEETNESLGRQIVAKDSPIVSGEQFLIGIVEYVGKKKLSGSSHYRCCLQTLRKSHSRRIAGAPTLAANQLST